MGGSTHPDNQDNAFQAVRGVTAACAALADKHGNLGHRVLYVPVVVVDSPLFLCFLALDGGEYVLERVDSGALLAPGPNGDRVLVQVVSIEALPRFLESLGRDATVFAQLLADGEPERVTT